MAFPNQLISDSTPIVDPDDYYVYYDELHANTDNSPMRFPYLDEFMEKLTHPEAHIIGVYGSNNIEDRFIRHVDRRIGRDKVFDVLLSVNVTKKADVKKIQDEIAGQLGFNFSKKSKGERAMELLDRIKQENNILIMLLNLYKAVDLGKIGIPFGEQHKGCKILISSSDAEMIKMIRSKQIHTDAFFRV